MNTEFNYSVYHNKADKCISIYKDGEERGYIAKLTHLKLMKVIGRYKSEGQRIATGLEVAGRLSNRHGLPIQIFFECDLKPKKTGIHKMGMIAAAVIGTGLVAACILWFM